MRFLADMGVSLRIVDTLRAQGHDAVHLGEQGLHRLPDEEVFRKAASEKRVLLTFDLDFAEIVACSGGRIVSVVLFRLRDTRTEHVKQRLARVLAESASSLEKGAVVTVEDFRHRVRSLPLG